MEGLVGLGIGTRVMRVSTIETFPPSYSNTSHYSLPFHISHFKNVLSTSLNHNIWKLTCSEVTLLRKCSRLIRRDLVIAEELMHTT